MELSIDTELQTEKKNVLQSAYFGVKKKMQLHTAKDTSKAMRELLLVVGKV